MAADLKEAIRLMIEEKNYTHDMVLETIREFVKAAYKRKYGTDQNVEISFSDDDELTVCARKIVVDEDNYYNEVTEIPLDEAQDLTEDVEIGDEILIPLDLSTFDRGSVQSAKQRAQQSFKEVQNNRTYKEFRAKEGEIILCYVNSELPNGDYRLNVGGGVEGILPRKNQSPRETYELGSEVKCYLEKVENADTAKEASAFNQKGRKQKKDVRIILSRTSPKLVEKLLFIQVPEIYDREVEIVKIVRQAGLRTKVAVRANSRDIDPVGATVGLKGNRIQAVITELDGEKIDIIPYDENPINYIASALTPAHVEKVYLIDMATKRAIAIVSQKDVGLAIGPKGSNVNLANSLCDWIIEVMTQEQFDELDLTQETRERAEAIFADGGAGVDVSADAAPLTAQELGIDENETLLSDLNISPELVEKLNFRDIYTAEEYFSLTPEELDEIGLSEEEKASINDCIDVEEETEEEFICPNCGATVKMGTTVCPNCGAEFEFEE